MAQTSVLVVPAAGLGSRLHSPLPKFLVPVAGRPMIDWLIDLYKDFVVRVVVVVAPSAERLAREHFAGQTIPVDVDVQEQPTGMLDAVLTAQDSVRRTDARRVWITWCDQIAISPATVAELARLSAGHPDAAVVMPIAFGRDPYIHLERGENGRISRVLHRREGDAMPEEGESDAGLFSLSRDAFLSGLPAYSAKGEVGTKTGERNLLPFIPWAAATSEVVTFRVRDEIEAVGINTPEELARVERHFEGLGSR